MIETYKGYIVKAHERVPTSYVVSYEGKGGGIPKMLDTLFTSPSLAKERIDVYLSRKEEEENGRKTRATSRAK